MSVSPLNSADLGRLVGLTDRQVRRLNRDGIFPREGKGRHAGFDPFVCVPLFVEYVRRGAEKTTGIADSRQKYVDAQLRALELKTRHTERELIPAEEVSQGMEAAMVTLGAGLDALGGRLCSELAGITDAAVIRGRIFDECRRLRNSAASALEALAGVAASRESTSGTNAAKPRRMGGRKPRAA
jgi:hypothetical protein